MRILVLGGSLFLSRAVAAEAAGRGHEVVAACRGSQPVPAGVEHVEFDRRTPDWSLLAGPWDAVFETQESPSWITAALDALAADTGHWTYVSSANVYADDSIPGGTPHTLELREPVSDEDESMEPAHYGGRKVACEHLVAGYIDAHLVARPGLIVGPGDPTGRFTYWPVRLGSLEAGAEVLAPGDPGDPMQVIDVRDQARWHVDVIERGVTGTFDVAGPATTIGSLLDDIVAGVGADVSFTWVPGDVLAANDVEPWMGPRSVPLWLPQPDYAGLVSHDVSATRAVGLVTRHVAETAADTLAWAQDVRQRTGEEVTVTGMTRAVELEVLAAWHDAG